MTTTKTTNEALISETFAAYEAMVSDPMNDGLARAHRLLSEKMNNAELAELNRRISVS